jgi:CheY-like chemotaxis protein
MISPWEVLIVEDDELDRTLVSELLALRGRGRARMTEARDLKSGLELLAARAFDLVLLDTKLPDASALYALRAVGDHAPNTPILPHTGYITPQMRQDARQRGAFEVVVRGELNPLWGAAHKLLTLETVPEEPRPAIQAVGR